uniref:EOG090X032R n=1 Tax=Panagrellus redivivus TaxID=6233 RepID=A0A7E4VRR7_PANRE
MVNPIFIICTPAYMLWFLVAIIVTCVSRKRANTSPLENPQRPSGKSQRTEEIFSPYASGEVRTSVSRTRSNNKSEQVSKKPSVKMISSKKKLDQKWKRKVRKIPKDGIEMEEPSADRDASPKEEKPVVEQTRIFSWNSGKKKSSNESSLDEFEKPTPMLEVTATDVSATQHESSLHLVTPTGKLTRVVPQKPDGSKVSGEPVQADKTPSTSPIPTQSTPTSPFLLPEQSTQPVSGSAKSTKIVKPGTPSNKKQKPKEGKSSPSTPTPPILILLDNQKSNAETTGSGGDKDKPKSSNSKSLENEILSKNMSRERVSRVAITSK